MPYVDAYVLPVLKSREGDYLEWARTAAQVWVEHGALSYMEARGDDVPLGKTTSFPRAVHLTEDEVVYVAVATYRDRAHRDAVMGLAMQDQRLAASFADSPADMRRMIFGGFQSIVSLP